MLCNLDQGFRVIVPIPGTVFRALGNSYISYKSSKMKNKTADFLGHLK